MLLETCLRFVLVCFMSAEICMDTIRTTCLEIENDDKIKSWARLQSCCNIRVDIHPGSKQISITHCLQRQTRPSPLCLRDVYLVNALLNAPISIKVIRSPKPQWRWTMSPARDLRCRRICLSSCGPKFQVCFSTDMKFLLVKSQHGTSNGCKNDLVEPTYLGIFLKPTNFGPVHGGLNYAVSATHVLNQKSPKMDGANNFHKTFSAHCNGTVMNWTACARFAHTCANT